MSNLGTKAVLSIGIRSAGAVLVLLLQVLLARNLGTNEYGIYSFVISWITIITLFTTLGFDTSLTRYLPQYQSKKQWPQFHAINKTAFLSCLAFSILIAIVLAIYFFGNKGFESKSAFIQALPLVIIITLTHIRIASLRALKQYAAAMLPETIIKPMLIIIAISAAALSGVNLSAKNAITIQTAAALISLAFGTWLLGKILRTLPTPSQTEYRTIEWLKSSVPMLMTSTSVYIISQTDIIMLGFLSGMHDSGIYSAISRVSEATLFFMSAVNFVNAPLISEAYQIDNRKRLQEVIRKSTRISFFLASVIFIIFILLGKELLGIFGDDFIVGYYALLILSAGHLANTASGPVGITLSMTGNQMYAAKVMSASAVLNLALNYILIPQYGLLGAAMSTMTSTLLWNMLMLSKVMQILRINPSILG